MESNVLDANKSLADRLHDLQAQLAKKQKMLELCLETIDQFGHFVPTIIELFRKEMKKLDAEGAVVGNDESDQEEEEPTVYANLIKDSISASDDLEMGDGDES